MLTVLDEVAALADLDRLDRVVALVVLGERLAIEVVGELVGAGQVDRALLDPADAVVKKCVIQLTLLNSPSSMRSRPMSAWRRTMSCTAGVSTASNASAS